MKKLQINSLKYAINPKYIASVCEVEDMGAKIVFASGVTLQTDIEINDLMKKLGI